MSSRLSNNLHAFFISPVEVAEVGYPGGLRVVSLKPTSVTFSWNEAIYTVIDSNSKGFTYQCRMHYGSAYVTINITDASITSYTVEGLIPCTYGFYAFSIAYVQWPEQDVGEFSPLLPVTTPASSMLVCMCVHACMYMRANISMCASVFVCRIHL